MYFPFSKLKEWGKRTAETRRHNCAVLPYIPSAFFGLYEHYGYTYLRDIINYGSGMDHLFVKDL